MFKVGPKIYQQSAKIENTYSLRVLNVIGNLCGRIWVTYFTKIPYQTRRINWSKIISYFTCSSMILQQLFLKGIFHYHMRKKDKNNFRLVFYLSLLFLNLMLISLGFI